MSSLIGRTIVRARLLTKHEIEREGWDDERNHSATVLVLDDGSLIYPSRDEEGNGPGVLFGVNAKGEQVCHFVGSIATTGEADV